MQRTEEALNIIEHKSLGPKTIIVIGAASGGLAALTNIVQKLPDPFPACLVIMQHMRPGFTRLLANYLTRTSAVTVEEAEQRQPLKQSLALIAPGCHGLTIARASTPDNPLIVNIEDHSNSISKARSRIDAAMQSAAAAVGSHAIGVLLTGAGSDGRDGMKAIREAGGATLAQDQDSCLLFDMPSSAIEAGVVDEVLPLWNIADRLVELVGEG